jgi:Ca-activated chloride channel family protein
MAIPGDKMIGGVCDWAWRPFRVLGGAFLAAVILAGHGFAQEAALSAPSRIAPGSEFEIGWQGPDAPGDFIAIAGPDAPAASFLTYARTSAGSPAVLTAPGVGDYEVRYISAAGLAVLVRVPLSVSVEPAKGGITAPSEVEAGAGLLVSVTDPGEPADYITIVETGAPDAAFGPYARLKGALEVALTAPDTAGNYEIRHIQASGQAVLARAPLAVLEPAAAETAPPASETTGESAVASPQPAAQPSATLMALVAVDPAHGFRVAWTGPAAAGDRIAVLPQGGDPAAALDSRPVGAGSPTSLSAPDAPGKYEIVYIDSASGAVLARRGLEVR